MTVQDLTEKYKDKTAAEIIADLRGQYKDDPEAIEEIDRAVIDIEYIEKQTNYKGQTPRQRALSLAGELSYWH